MPQNETTVRFNRTLLREVPIERKVVDFALRDFGVASIKLRMGQGWPDRLFFTPRTPTWIEFKRPGEGPSKLQQERISFLNALGYCATWTDDPVIALSLLQARIRG